MVKVDKVFRLSILNGIKKNLRCSRIGSYYANFGNRAYSALRKDPTTYNGCEEFRTIN